jgi:hypothetical protein
LLRQECHGNFQPSSMYHTRYFSMRIFFRVFSFLFSHFRCFETIFMIHRFKNKLAKMCYDASLLMFQSIIITNTSHETCIMSIVEWRWRQHAIYVTFSLVGVKMTATSFAFVPFRWQIFIHEALSFLKTFTKNSSSSRSHPPLLLDFLHMSHHFLHRVLASFRVNIERRSSQVRTQGQHYWR